VKAAHDLGRNWVTLELRHDRVYETFTKAAYKGLENICVVGGNALEVLPRLLAAESIDHAFVNYPEPPQQTGGSDYASQSKHLLCDVRS
jgi:tRNA G46 methylase TrmB